VLLVDSDPEFQGRFATSLKKFGCRLESLVDPARLDSMLKSLEPAVLVVSVDNQEANAIELVADLRASVRWADLPIFVVGNRLATKVKLSAYEVGADAALSKGTGLGELTARTLGCVRRQSERAERPEPEPAGRVADSEPVTGVPDVVVVEDDSTLQEMMRYSLSNHGYELVAYSNGRVALDALLALETGGRRPVVLLDVDLPGLDGFRILQELTANRPGDFQVIITTVHSSEAAQVLAIESGAMDYIVKPVSMPVTLAKVERLVNGGAAG
jgi:DNA-binding response OmpR family regulator